MQGNRVENQRKPLLDEFSVVFVELKRWYNVKICSCKMKQIIPWSAVMS